MNLKIARAVLALAMATALGCARQAEPPADPAEEAYQDLWQAVEELETPAAKAEAAEAFLAEHPTSDRAATVLEVAVYYRSEVLGEHAGALRAVEDQLEHLDDPEDRFDAQLMLYDLSVAAGTGDEPGPGVDLRNVAAELAAHQELGYGHRLDLMDSAARGGEWQLALEQADAALALATTDAYRAEHEGEELDPEDVERRVQRRQARALAGRGEALTGLDRIDEAMEVFAAAREVTSTNYVGMPGTDLNLYQARAELERGRFEQAIELLEPDAIMGGDAEALEMLRRTYAEVNGSDEGFDTYLDEARRRLAPEVDSFTLETYEGEPIELASYTSGKVTLLAFWFPT